MSDLIRRADAIKVIEQMKHRLEGSGQTYEFLLQMMNDVRAVEPRRGHWIDLEDGGRCCSECGAFALAVVENRWATLSVESNYCPNCGARMK